MTASTDIAVRASAELVPAGQIVARTTAMDPFLAADITEALVAMKAAREAWEQRLSDSIPVVLVGEEPLVEPYYWTSPMTGRKLAAVAMDWSGLDWSRGRGGAA